MKSNIFYRRLKNLSVSAEKSFNQIEKELDYPRNALSNYKENSMPSAARLMELSEYFNVTPEYLFGLENQKTHDYELVSALYNLLTPEQRIEMNRVCRHHR